MIITPLRKLENILSEKGMQHSETIWLEERMWEKKKGTKNFNFLLFGTPQHNTKIGRDQVLVLSVV